MLGGSGDDGTLLGWNCHYGGIVGVPDSSVAVAGEVFMTTNGWFQIGLYVTVLWLLVKPLGDTWRASISSNYSLVWIAYWDRLSGWFTDAAVYASTMNRHGRGTHFRAWHST